MLASVEPLVRHQLSILYNHHLPGSLVPPLLLSPREAALATVRAINSRNPHTALLAIQLLKTLVKECGYPFHLQIATKEFLNELVRRFPERPPMVLGPVMGKILEVSTRILYH